MTPCGADDSELQLARSNAFDDGVRVGDGQEHADVGIQALELAEDDRDDDRRRTRGGPQDEVAGEVTLTRRRHLRDELILEREHPLRAAVEPPARLRRLHAPSRAVEELRPEPLLESAHLERHRRLGHAEAVGRLGEATAFDHRAERG